MITVTYDKEMQQQAALAVYRYKRLLANRISDAEGCGAVLVIAFPPH